jgi:hypothetical protein
MVQSAVVLVLLNQDPLSFHLLQPTLRLTYRTHPMSEALPDLQRKW